MVKHATSVIEISNGIVKKTVTKWQDIVFKREVMWLKTFSESDRFPKLLGTDDKNFVIFMTCCGEPINKLNCPSNWSEQLEELLKELKKYNCSHNDIKASEILVLKKQIMLVDFGWATKIGEPIPKNWPSALGETHSLGMHKFDDRHACFEAMKGVLKK